jgi:acetylornithine deacetylase/succinyl-diaminopimelate desuccinylase-like protein
MNQRLIRGLAALISFSVGGSKVAEVPGSDDGLKEGLAAHVRFLSQPELKGRQPQSAGSRQARRYIEDRFRACGLRPWSKAKNYELSFGLGKNVVGILPGSDANSSNEMVLLSAHYDHLGKDGKGNIYPGAADNASGVAVLLEAARQLSRREHRRTVAFAAFDAEEQMMLGSFAFTCRPDVERARIVAVINVDTLGRDFLEVVPNTLFVTGTEGHLALQTQVRGFGAQAGLRVLPLGSDFIGPRSDHVPFEARKALCLFFTSGTFAGYHRPSDTAEKLNFINLERSTQVILRTVEVLADQAQDSCVARPGGDPEELRSLQAVLSDLCASPEKAGIKAQDLEALHHLSTNIQTRLDTGTFDRTTREEILLEAASHVMPYAMGRTMTGRERFILMLGEHVYFNYRREWIEGQQQLVAATLKHPPGLLRGLPAFKHQFCGMRDEDLSVVQTGTNAFALHALMEGFSWTTYSKTVFWPFKSSGASLEPTSETLDCEGSREQLTDYCLMKLRAGSTNMARVKALATVLRAVNGAEPWGSYAEWLPARLAQTGCKDENEWLLSCLRSGNPDLVEVAIRAANPSQDSRIQAAICELLLSRGVQPNVRRTALYFAESHPNRTSLLSLVQVLDDSSPGYRPDLCPQNRSGYPLTNSTSFLAIRPVYEWLASHPSDTIGQTALRGLKRVTKKDFGQDAQAWKNWVQNSTK